MKKFVLAALLVLGSVLPAHATTNWDIGFRVTTIRPTNVVVKWRVTCSNGGIAIQKRGVVHAQAPLTRHLQSSLAGASSCHVNVVAWDIKPWVRPNEPPPPVVTTWVNHG